ncbi:MAG TPA: carbamoyltransferase HypF [Polyangiaceae bacterium]|nr:carbamoyltransferase HypF [Polyangiaceae bacterium]
MARCAIDVSGVVQGVGFRPFVHGLAERFSLAGFVENGGGEVHIEVEGPSPAIEAFLFALAAGPGGSASVQEIRCRLEDPRGESGFVIRESRRGFPTRVVVPPDTATCDACLEELFEPADRRQSHPFITCTHCGPRATIITDLPYDRERTTMASFGMCPRCRAEYEASGDRRFHAQPIACPDCGPKLSLRGRRGELLRSADPIAEFSAAIACGSIGALKGIGGYHLLCDATNPTAVTRLRQRKQRDGKPFAVMVGDVRAAGMLGLLEDAAADLLESPARPVVLVPRLPGAPLAAAVAPGLDTIGLLLPYSPVHHLVLRCLGPVPVVVTSGNASEEPIASTEAEAFEQLGGIADVFLVHDRPIHLSMEDSVVRAVPGGAVPLRRSRGYAPLPVPIAFDAGVPTLAVGGDLKSVFALGAGRDAVLGPHLGDLSSLRAGERFRAAVRHFERLFGVRPARIVTDLHPDYAGTRYAEERLAREPDLDVVGVQHHHAHFASCLAEHSASGDVIGVCFDGTGFGTDGNAWGGEFFVGGFSRVDRAAHLSPVGLVGGDRAAREPFRLAAAHLVGAGLSPAPVLHLASLEPRLALSLERILASGDCPRTTSMGRLFDAVASLANVVHRASYEGEAAMRLETLAARRPPEAAYPVELSPGAPLVVDTASLVRAVVEDVRSGRDPSVVARRFHSWVVEMVVAVCTCLRDRHGLGRVALSGGVFANAILSDEIPRSLEDVGFIVLSHRVVPPNDGGLALGQLAVAAHGGGTPLRLRGNGAR